jgi:hypothetical protein
VRALACEFPNDNPLLHGGTSWVCLTTTGAPTGERGFLEEIEAACVEDAPIEVAELEPLPDDAFAEPPEIVAPPLFAEEGPRVLAGTGPGSVPAFEEVSAVVLPSDVPPPADDPFQTLVCILSDVAIAAGAHDVASWLPGLLFDGRLPDLLDEASAAALLRFGLLSEASPPVVDPQFIARMAAWRAILRGTSDDFDACGSLMMLDEWTSSLLAAVLDRPSTTVRQELRSRGVAAFGMAA